MRRLFLPLPEHPQSRIEAPKSAPADTADLKIVLLGVLLATITLAYFYAADNYYFSTKMMAPIFQYLLMVEDFDTAWLTLGTCILAACWKNPYPVLKVVDFIGSNVGAVAWTAVALLSLTAIYIYHNCALSMDEYAAVFQAKIFATGRWTAELPSTVVDWLIPPGFNGAFLIASRTTGQAIEAYWPGFALVLAPFEFIGLPFVCNASLAGLAIFLIHRITLEICNDRRSAGWAVMFAVASGAFVANAICYYSMQAHLTANLLFVWLLLSPSPLRAFGAGVVGSLALVLHNPFPHAMFAAPWIIALARSKNQRSSFYLLTLGYLPLLILVGTSWLRLRAQITASSPGLDLISHTVNGVFSLPKKSMFDIRVASTIKMWVWAVPCLFVFAALGRIRRGEDQRIRLMTQSAVVTFVGYLFVIFDQGHGWGYRYFHSAWGVVPILAGCAMSARGESTGRLAAFAGAVAILNVSIVVPFQMLQIDGVIKRHLAQLPPSHRPGNDVFFIRSPGGFYAADLVQTDPFLRAQDLFLMSRGPELDAELRRQNWPGAVLVEAAFGVEEWNLGSKDLRRSAVNSSIKRLEVAYSDHALPIR